MAVKPYRRQRLILKRLILGTVRAAIASAAANVGPRAMSSMSQRELINRLQKQNRNGAFVKKNIFGDTVRCPRF